MTYNWQLWDNFVAAAQELELELVSKDGGCVYMDVPKDIRDKFYVMCWTPLNKLRGVMKDHKEGSILGTWQHRLMDLRQNYEDFHLEFGAKWNEDGGTFWFPHLGIGCPTPSKDDIVKAVQMMLDRDNFDKYVTLALLRKPAEEIAE